MKVIEVGYGKTFNLGNFESERLDLKAELDEGDDVGVAMHALKNMVYVMFTQGGRGIEPRLGDMPQRISYSRQAPYNTWPPQDEYAREPETVEPEDRPEAVSPGTHHAVIPDPGDIDALQPVLDFGIEDDDDSGASIDPAIYDEVDRGDEGPWGDRTPGGF